MTQLLMNEKKTKVFLFNKSLGEQVWEAEPVTRFQFRKPTKNQYIQEVLNKPNKPTTGIIHNDVVYIGTNDGFIYTQDNKIQRIPDIIVDPQLFWERVSENDKQKKAFLELHEKGTDALSPENRHFWKQVNDFNRLKKYLKYQEDTIERFHQGHLGIKGFVIHQPRDMFQKKVYDGSFIGIYDTEIGKQLNELPVHAMHQIEPKIGGFVVSSHPAIPTQRIEIDKGLVKRINAPCVDYRGLWDISGQGIYASSICPRNGSGYKPAIFASNGKVDVTFNNGILNISTKKKESFEYESSTTIMLPTTDTPKDMFVKDNQVIARYNNSIKDLNNNITFLDLKDGEITSLSPSGLCTILKDNKTKVCNIYNLKILDTIPRDYCFLNPTSQ